MEYVALLIGLLVLSAFFSSSETAFLSLQRLKLEHYVREGRPGAKAVSSLLLQPGKLLSAILIGNNLVNAAAATMTAMRTMSLVRNTLDYLSTGSRISGSFGRPKIEGSAARKGAAVRIATRSFAERARGLASISSGVGEIAPPRLSKVAAFTCASGR